LGEDRKGLKMALPCGVYNQTYSEDFALIRTKAHWVLLFGWILLIFILPVIIGPTLTSWLTLLSITILSAMGLNVIAGYCGQLSIGHTAFMAVGAFTYANLARIGLWWPLAILCGGLNGAIVGTIFGLPSLRVKELYLALTTLAAQFIVPWFIVEFFRGGVGVVPPSPTIGSLVLKEHHHFYYLCWIVTLAVTYLVYNLSRTKIGRAYKAIRDQDLAAQAMGINVGLYKVSSFTIGCFIAGLAGGLWALWIGRADIEHFTIMESIWYVAMLITGGGGSIVGIYLGVIFISGLWELSVTLSGWLTRLFPGYDQITSGIPSLLVALAIIVFVILEPRGLNHRWLILKESYRLWPWSHW
jgi:branched-chain amino acid transport system permease protein